MAIQSVSLLKYSSAITVDSIKNTNDNQLLVTKGYIADQISGVTASVTLVGNGGLGNDGDGIYVKVDDTTIEKDSTDGVLKAKTAAVSSSSSQLVTGSGVYTYITDNSVSAYDADKKGYLVKTDSSTGKISLGLLPDLNINNVFTATSTGTGTGGMRAAATYTSYGITPNIGDVCLVTEGDVVTAYILTKTPYTTDGNWVKLNTPSNSVVSITGNASGSAAATGGISIANAKTTSDSITINTATDGSDSANATLGLASFNSSHFSVSSGFVSIQANTFAPHSLVSTVSTHTGNTTIHLPSTIGDANQLLRVNSNENGYEWFTPSYLTSHQSLANYANGVSVTIDSTTNGVSGTMESGTNGKTTTIKIGYGSAGYFGVVKVDNKTITATSGVITATIPSWAEADYAVGAVVTYNKLLYRAKKVVASSVTTNPASDTTNWEVITKDSNTTYSAATTDALGLVQIPAESTSYLNNDSGTIKVAVKTNGGIVYDSTANATGLYVNVDGTTLVNNSGTLKAAVPIWKVNTGYSAGTVVWHGGRLYKCVSDQDADDAVMSSAPGTGTGNTYWSPLVGGFRGNISTSDSFTSYSSGDFVLYNGLPYVVRYPGSKGNNFAPNTLVTSATNNAANSYYQALLSPASATKWGLVKVDGETITAVSSTGDNCGKISVDCDVVADRLLDSVGGFDGWAASNSSEKTYYVGDVVYWEGQLYKCIQQYTASTGTDTKKPGTTAGNSWWQATDFRNAYKYSGTTTVATNEDAFIEIEHKLGTKDITVQVYQTDSDDPDQETTRIPVLVEFEFGKTETYKSNLANNTNTIKKNNITLRFANGQLNTQYYRVVILAAR